MFGINKCFIDSHKTDTYKSFCTGGTSVYLSDTGNILLQTALCLHIKALCLHIMPSHTYKQHYALCKEAIAFHKATSATYCLTFKNI